MFTQNTSNIDRHVIHSIHSCLFVFFFILQLKKKKIKYFVLKKKK